MTLQVTGLSKEIDGRQIIQDINFEWAPGEIIGLVGRNGVGKTTLFRTMMNHYVAEAGHVVVDGDDLQRVPVRQQQLFFIDTQYNFLGAYRLWELPRFFGAVYPQFDEQRFTVLINQFKINANSQYRRLSKGMRALVNLILALTSNATYILLDEPFDGLDVIVRENIATMVIDEIADQQKGFLISSHDLNELDGLSDRVLLLKDSQLVHDYNLEEIRARAKKIQLVLRDKEIPAVLKQNSQLIRVSGRVLVVVIPQYTPEVDQELKALKPVLFEELPLTLEDLFRANLAHDTGYQMMK
ncbi:ATP-binding cassette domain-containing protein [Levilactobacillus tujiorum]|uniref:ABC transporter ATP-binding protein n=1 Tax=Levilactobacillus tujiorum TaxID=2912243 RepID=A0ABX1L5P5_9LACO|nr:ABC transporter ATP-binding protein [Levilactobacillus tujiorum]MCH5464983.1 ABC transporter ATP-binding protein [Levilactobacillus tujiorum]NLR11979.1 ABC transporter ATP-binding protein [Lactobacillus sp. HBUAS51387]NLR29973.1 ABC transporter ATP-binding protein [Levilactobacillus tujiorum]